MKIIKAIIVAFSMYSRIPMPQFAWKDEDMKYMLCFFPWVGAVIGACLYGWYALSSQIGIDALGYTLVGMVIPLLITGGFHVDGYMDTMDAFHSYQPKERKLEILKDSHIGAFSVISLVIYGLIYGAAFSEIRDVKAIAVVSAGFVLARCLSGIGVVTFLGAKKEGLLFMFASKAQKTIVKGALYIQGVLCIAVMILLSPVAGCVAVLTALGTLWYYYRKTKKELGGITGDTSGWFVLLCEGAMVVSVAVAEMITLFHK